MSWRLPQHCFGCADFNPASCARNHINPYLGGKATMTCRCCSGGLNGTDFTQGKGLGMRPGVLLALGGAGAALGCCAGRWPKLLGSLSLLAWAAAEAAKLAWQQHKAQPELLAALAGDDWGVSAFLMLLCTLGPARG